jgi:hypothetical protein
MCSQLDPWFLERRLSSTASMKYLHPPLVAGVIGPHKSMCTNSNGSIDLHMEICENDLLVCFALKQE